jgi:ABC-2 type transport system permease protein
MSTISVDASIRAPHQTNHLLSDSLVFTRRRLAHIRQLPEKLIEVTVQPIMFVLLFAYVFGGAINVPGSNYRQYLIGGILVQSVAFGLGGPATSMATDLTEGVVDRFRSLPSSAAAYLFGHFLAELLGLMLAISVLTATGLLVGWRTSNDVPHVVGAFVLLVLFGAAMIVIGTLIGLTVRTPDAVMGLTFIVVFPMTFVSNAFVPLTTLPAVLQTIAAYNPVSIVVAAVRELFGNPSAPTSKHSWILDHQVASATVWCLLLLAIATPLALHKYRLRTVD